MSARRVRHLKMSPQRHRTQPAANRGTGPKSRFCSPKAVLLVALLALSAPLLEPAAAAAHGPVDPAATSYLATVRQTPPGIEAKVVDGDQRMWIQAPGRLTVVVLDYSGAPYLRFSAQGVAVNHNSSMYYSNQVPAEATPPNIGPKTPPSWHQATSVHAYEWHDGRLHALAATALAPGATYVGRWTLPLRVDGRPATIAGGLRYAPNPSLVWFWPVVVVVLCVIAGVRLRRAELDVQMARGLSFVALAATTVAGFGEQLHGRPDVTVGQLILLAVLLAFVAWALRRLVLGRHGWFGFFLIALVALWEGASLVGVLVHGFVLLALPAFVARAAVVVCLATGGALLPVIFRLAETPERPGRATSPAPTDEAELDWEGEAAWDWDA